MKLRNLIGIITENEIVEIRTNSMKCYYDGEFGKIPDVFLDKEIEGMCSLPCSREYNSFTFIKLK